MKNQSTAPAKKIERVCYRIQSDTGSFVGEWSNESLLPEIGTQVYVSMNGLGAGKVCNYFVASGYIGLGVLLQNPPAWFVKQNGGNVPANVFGAEVKIG